MFDLFHVLMVFEAKLESGCVCVSQGPLFAKNREIVSGLRAAARSLGKVKLLLLIIR